MGVTNAVAVDADARRTRSRWSAPARAAWRPRRRWSPTSSTSRAACACRRSAAPAAELATSRKAPMQRHEGGYYIRLLARDKPGTAATIARRLAAAGHLAGIDRAAPSGRVHRAATIRTRRPGPVPVILITYATTEDAVRRALAAVEARPGVIGGAAGHPDREELRRQAAVAGESEMSTITVQAAPDARAHPVARDRARDRARGGVGGAAARPRQREGGRPGRGRRHAARAQQAADRRHGGDRRGRARRGADAVHRREGRQQDRPEGRHRGRSARRHDAVRQEHAGRDRHHGDGRGRHAAQRARRLHGQDRDRPRLSRRAWSISTRRPSENIRNLAKAKGVQAGRHHGADPRPAAPCRPDRGGAQDRRVGAR